LINTDNGLSVSVQLTALSAAASHPERVHFPSVQYGGVVCPQSEEKINKHLFEE
jgi:hypothetical protein